MHTWDLSFPGQSLKCFFGFVPNKEMMVGPLPTSLSPSLRARVSGLQVCSGGGWRCVAPQRRANTSGGGAGAGEERFP